MPAELLGFFGEVLRDHNIDQRVSRLDLANGLALESVHRGPIYIWGLLD